MPDDPLTSALDEYAAFFEAEGAREKQNTWHVGAARRKGERLEAAVRAVVNLAESWQQDQARTAVGATSRRNGARILALITRELTGDPS